MIPLRDNVPSSRRPLVTWTIIGLCTVLFLFEQLLPEPVLYEFLHIHGVVPARYTDPAYARAMGYPEGGYESLVTYMFLHGGWLHFLLNMWVLWIFSDNVEEALGPVRFTLFYLLCGLLAAAAHILFNWNATVPVIGASGAIAGVMGAYFRLFPRARVVTLIPIIIIPWIIELPAVVFLGIWFCIQLLSGLTGAAGGNAAASVAFWAHAGGFVAGLSLVRLFLPPGCRFCFDPRNRRYDRDA
ncbi:MAG: rhomboid family intramembrane serine protease [Solidesulfovibrio sp.]|uniref:rhomboid family intramembrane serine protease n=1 Tax=Solidesulfovibrio sp. TaxID=2910990 RepID=UPI002B206584|nr:rhomboid family intramembrane serine protease [Solidesulfovibrio sp.]MEA4855088.1 rhomboid family intramembrane serine protease [Solidesulfovibrio sp.]